jgi:hypothetical protein
VCKFQARHVRPGIVFARMSDSNGQIAGPRNPGTGNLGEKNDPAESDGSFAYPHFRRALDPEVGAAETAAPTPRGVSDTLLDGYLGRSG